jgi:RNA polymerase sigma factor (sigma-70 family)
MTVDEKIVEGCIAGKRRSQNQLYEKYSSGMLGICLRYCRNLEDAEDVLQEGFIKVFHYIQTFRGESSIGAWIKRIMINTAITHNKKMDSMGAGAIDTLDTDDFMEPEDNDIVFQPIEPEKLLRVIQELPEGYRTVLNLYVFEGYSHKEIAVTLNIAESTSKTQLFKARKFLRNKLEPVIRKDIVIK